MNGVWPMGRVARAYGAVLTFVLLPACAHGAALASAKEQARGTSAELETLKGQLAVRDYTIEQLEGRLAMIEASQRQLRGELEAERSLEPMQEAPPREVLPRETVRIGSRGRTLAREAAPPGSAPPAPASSAAATPEVRPMLRLHADRRESNSSVLTSRWTPPTTTERLTVSPLPALPSARIDAGASPSAGASPWASARTEAAAEAASASHAAHGPTESPQEDLYVHALDLLRRRELAEALRELDAFVRDLPGDARYARAQFWRGEILFAERQFTRALDAYEQALVREPSGDKVPDALLRIGRCHVRLGANDRARTAWLRLRAQFPNSPAAREAAREADQVAQEDT